MPVEMNEDGTLTLTPPWSLAEIIEAMNYEVIQDGEGVIIIRSSTPSVRIDNNE